MAIPNLTQLSLFNKEETRENNNEEWGTFKDSLKAPIHSWFTYPAGFSYRAVESSLKANNLVVGDTLYDPFMGSGTTNLVAKKSGLNSYGIEAHPFVFKIAKTKLNWEINTKDVIEAIEAIKKDVQAQRKTEHDVKAVLEAEFPELVLKCFETNTLFELLLIRDTIVSGGFEPDLTDFLLVGLTGLLREVSSVATGWPYIAPNKAKTSSLRKNALVEYGHLLLKMMGDIEITTKEANANYRFTSHRIFNGDSRNTHGLIPDNCIDHIFTSPPYLNNFDYADRTRLEMYFFGEAKSWGEITRNVRAKLITSATTQISRDDPRYLLSQDLQKSSPEVYDFLDKAVAQLAKVRLTKGGKKSYDHLVSGYFNDMYLVLTDVFRVLKSGKKAVFVLGDSAPYGVHIPTDELIGKIGVSAGFSDFKIDMLRTRGEKWRDNPQRHTVKLRESIVTLRKN